MLDLHQIQFVKCDREIGVSPKFHLTHCGWICVSGGMNA